ncbi:VWA domain-containing protein [Tenacibaculum xiamenense]|uniref:VWA domain-containing protein n=1 Tax=Tenacibaculum xiamenense TaxID=1261553 RepID=UPI003894D9AD
MESLTLIYVVVALLVSLAVAFFQYFYKERKQPKITIALFALRALSLFFIGILLINPQFNVVSTENIKPIVSLLIDDSKSTSIFNEEKNVENIVEAIKANEKLNEKFEVIPFSFGESLKPLDSLTFEKGNTDINEAIATVNKLYPKHKLATILVTDGNQTTGNDYEYYSTKNKIYPVVLGDTTKYQDIQLTQLNVNKYSYIKNKFPVEALIHYEGDESVSSVFTITHKGRRVFTKKLEFSPNQTSQTVSTTLTSNEKGVQYYQASISRLSGEKNTKNNYKSFSVEVIDEQTKVLLLSSILHPDLGALKKSIESNKQRKVDIKIMNKDTFVLDDYQMYVFYQPNFHFRRVFEQISTDYLLISGTKTDWRFLSTLGLGVNRTVINQQEVSTASYNDQFLTFLQENIGFEEFPPLEDTFGKIELTRSNQVLLSQNIGGVDSGQPLLATLEEGENNTMILFGEGIWKWRAASFMKDKTFESFDAFTGNIVQYLATNKKRSRLEVKAKSIYPANESITFSAFYVDKNYRFDNRASLELRITNKETKKVVNLPFSLMNNSYQVSVEGLEPGSYSYQVSVKNQTIKKFGRFNITEFEIEDQFVNANEAKLKKLALNTKGKLFYKNEIESLISELNSDTEYFTIQKSTTSKKNLIEWYWILMLIVFLLSLEWFIRKYYGRI